MNVAGRDVTLSAFETGCAQVISTSRLEQDRGSSMLENLRGGETVQISSSPLESPVNHQPLIR